MVKLFLGGFPLDMQEMELAQLIAIHGAVSTIKIVRDKKTGVCKGYAFIEMPTLQDAENAIKALTGTPIGKRELVLNLVPEPKSPTLVQPISATRITLIHYEKPALSTGKPKHKRPRKQYNKEKISS